MGYVNVSSGDLSINDIPKCPDGAVLEPIQKQVRKQPTEVYDRHANKIINWARQYQAGMILSSQQSGEAVV